MSAADLATLATAVFAAVAAAASWASVLQTRRERLSARTPELLLEVVEELTTKHISVHIHNHGGPAVRVRFAVALGNNLAYGHPAPTATFLAGEGRVIETTIVTPGNVPAPGFVAGWNTAGTHLYAAWTDGKRAVYDRRAMRAAGTTDDYLLKQVLPEFDISRMNIVRCNTTERWS
jgi:hypothetical protein